MEGYTVDAIAAHVGGTVSGDGRRLIIGATTPELAGPHDLVYLASPKYLRALGQSLAGAALVLPGVPTPPSMAAIVVSDPALSMARAVGFLVREVRTFHDISPRAVVGERVEIGEAVGIAPGVVVGDDVRIGSGTEIFPQATIGARASIGKDCRIHAGVHIYADTIIGDRVVLHAGVVLGADGFGFVQERVPPPEAAGGPVRHRKMPQLGRVIIEDDVEIGANSTVDRSTFSSTRIGRGTKIDNLVTIGHNVVVGRHCLIIGQAGISGSTTLGDYVTVAGQAGLTGHLRIGSRATIGAQAGVTHDVAEATRVVGSPALEEHRAKRALVLIGRLPDLKKALADHRRRIEHLEATLDDRASAGGPAVRD